MLKLTDNWRIHKLWRRMPSWYVSNLNHQVWGWGLRLLGQSRIRGNCEVWHSSEGAEPHNSTHDNAHNNKIATNTREIHFNSGKSNNAEGHNNNNTGSDLQQASWPSAKILAGTNFCVRRPRGFAFGPGRPRKRGLVCRRRWRRPPCSYHCCRRCLWHLLLQVKIPEQLVFSYASSSALYPCEWVSKSVIVSN